MHCVVALAQLLSVPQALLGVGTWGWCVRRENKLILENKYKNV